MRTFFLTLVMLAGLYTSTINASQAQRQQYKSALTALQTGKFDAFIEQSRGLTDYVLFPYLEYYRLIESLGKLSDGEIVRFIDTYEDTPLASLLRKKWLEHLAAGKQWKAFLRVYQPQSSTTLRCHYLNAVLHEEPSHEAIDKALAEAMDLWLVGNTQPKACIPVFKRLHRASRITAAKLWRRIDLAMQQNNIHLVKHLADSLNKRDRQAVALWIRVHQSPEKGLSFDEMKEDTVITRKIALHAINRISYRDARKANQLLEKRGSRYAFENSSVLRLQRSIAVRAARQFQPGAVTLLKRVPQDMLRESDRVWIIRSALREQQWNEVSTAIEQLPESEKSELAWRYWAARAQEASGNGRDARKVYQNIALNTHYYGFLAADRIGRGYVFDTQPVVRKSTEIDAIKVLPGIVRARELYALERYTEARREWYSAIGGFDHARLGAAALLANEWGWYDTAILTIARTRHRKDFNLRFPTPFEDIVKDRAKIYGVEPSMIYGVARRESAFDARAVSSAGAIGVMQLMPGTARQQARQLGLSKPNVSQLKRADINFTLGTAYLGGLIERFEGSEVLAMAAYNAGPSRVKRWLPQGRKIDADSWIETVPFKETRAYIKAVLAYSTIFAWKLNEEVIPLKKRMLLIGQSKNL